MLGDLFMSAGYGVRRRRARARGELHNEGAAHCESSLFNNEGIGAHCWNNEPLGLCRRARRAPCVPGIQR